MAIGNWQLALRGFRRWVVRPALLLLIGYLTIPWWLPTNWLRGQIIAQLQHDLGRPVALASIEVSWQDGVVLRDLRIYQADEFGQDQDSPPAPYLLRAERISCPLTPLGTLFFRTIPRLKLDEARIWIVRNQSGALNVDELAARLPSNKPSLSIGEICCDGTTVLLINRQSRQAAELRLGTLNFRMDSPRGMIRAFLSGSGAYRLDDGLPPTAEANTNGLPLGDFSVSADMLDPSVRAAAGGGDSQGSQGGKVQVSWRTVDLAKLAPLTGHDWPQIEELGLLGVAGPSGFCDGKLELNLDANGRIAWRIDARLKESPSAKCEVPNAVDRGPGPGPVVSDQWPVVSNTGNDPLTTDHWPLPTGSAELNLAGAYDLASLRFSIDTLAVALPGLALKAKLDRRPLDNGYFAIQIEEARVDLARLRQTAGYLHLKWLDWIDPKWELAGPLAFKGQFEWSDMACAANLDVDATDLRIKSDWLTKGPGTPARAIVRARHERDVDRLSVDQFSVQLGRSQLAITGLADQLYPVFTGSRKVWDVWLDWNCRLQIRTPDAAELLALAPALQDSATMARATITGPAELEFGFQGTPTTQPAPAGQGRGQEGTARDGGPQSLARQLSARLVLDAKSTFRLLAPEDEPPDMEGTAQDEQEDALEALLDKPAGEPLTISLVTQVHPFDSTIAGGSLLVCRGANCDNASEGDATASNLGFQAISGKVSFNYPTDSAGLKLKRSGPQMNVVLDGELVGRQLEHLVEISPWVQRQLERQHLTLSGGLDGQVNLRLGPQQMRVRLAVDLARMGLRVAGPQQMPDVFVKPLGEPVRVEADLLSYPAEPGRRDGDDSDLARQDRVAVSGLGLRLEANRIVDWSQAPGVPQSQRESFSRPSAQGEGSVDWPIPATQSEQRDLHIAVTDFATLLGHCPLLEHRLRQEGLTVSGSASGRGTWWAPIQHTSMANSEVNIPNTFELTLDAGGLDVGLAKTPAEGGRLKLYSLKPGGMPLGLHARCTTNLPDEPVIPQIKLGQVELTVGQSQLAIHGDCQLLPVWWGDVGAVAAEHGGPPELTAAGDQSGQPASIFGPMIWLPKALNTPPPIDRLGLSISGRLVIDSQLRQALEAWTAGNFDCRDWGLAGSATVTANVRGNWRELQVQAKLDGEELAIYRPGVLIKDRGTSAGVDLDVIAPPWPGQGSRPEEGGPVAAGTPLPSLPPGGGIRDWQPQPIWQIRRLDGWLADMSFKGNGMCGSPLPEAGQPSSGPGPHWALPRYYDLKLGLNIPDLARVAEACPALLGDPELLDGPLTGRVSGEIHLGSMGGGTEDSEFRVARSKVSQPGQSLAAPLLLPSYLELDRARGTLAGTPLAVSGRIELSQRSLFIPRLNAEIGRSKLGLVAQIADPVGNGKTSGPRGWIDLAGPTLDVDELGGLWARLQTVRLPGANSELPPKSEMRNPKSESSPSSAPDAGAAGKIIDFLARCDISGHVHLADLFVSDPKNQTRYKLEEFKSRFTIDAGLICVPFQTAMEGGTLDGTVSSNLLEPTPLLAVRYDAYKLLPTPGVKPLVEAFFPGMTVGGYVTMKEHNQQKLLAAPGEKNWSVGSGELIFENGVLVGQAGPDWMVNIFPGLKLSEYHFERMHDWFNLTADGKANHNMSFEGRDYHVYMEGYNDRGTGQAEYTVGVNLLASLDSKTLSVDLRQGKIPLMYVSGRIENRKLQNPSFTMVSPPVALWDMFIRDSILYRGLIEKALKAGK